ncbi:MAG: Abi family protein [Bacilli bacterium]|nr:Abi family protein [Bacilli bacterium]
MKDNLLPKKMLKISEMVEYLKEKNIKFNIISESEAEIYLKNNNNYYNITIYKSNFMKYQCGKHKGKYIDLDFAYLKDLSIIDYRTRLILFKMTIDIEHYLKIRILNLIENINEEDGYKIVNLFLEQDYNNDKFPKKVHNSIRKKISSEYYNQIFSKYNIDNNNKIENIPIWEFLEIITFGELVNFFEFFTNFYNLDDKKYIYILREINKLRNAVAHNSCILSNLDKKDNCHKADNLIINYLKDCNIGKENRNNKLSNSRIRQITYTLCMFNIVVTSEGIKYNIKKEIKKLFYNRIVLHKEYYNNNELLKSIYNYFDNIVKKI